MSRSHKRICDMRTSDARTRAGALCDQRLRVDRTTHGAQPVCDFVDAADTIRSLGAKEVRQTGIRGVKEITEHVDVLAIFDSRDLDPGDEPDARCARRLARLIQPGSRVVVRDADNGETGGSRTSDKSRG